MEARRRRILERQRQQSQGLRETLSMVHLSILALGLILASGGAYLITESISATESFSLVAGGTFLALVSFFGWFGTLHEHAGFLKTYCSVLGVVVLGQWIGLGWLYYENQQDGGTWRRMDQRISKTWDFFSAHDDLVVKDIEQVFHCCGYGSAQDRPVPVTCQRGAQGCKVIGLQLIEQWQWSLVVGFVLLTMIQVCLLLVNVVTLVMVEKESTEEASEDRLQKQHVIRYGWMISDHDGSHHDYGSNSSINGGGGRPYYHSTRNPARRNGSNPSVAPSSPPHYYGSVNLG